MTDIKQLITPLLLAYIIPLFLSGCSKIDLDFTTKSNFKLNASYHEFDVKTRQDHPAISAIVVNEQETILSLMNASEEEYIAHDYDGFSVKYRYGVVEEIMGEWFNIKTIDGYTTHISIDENKTGTDRSLSIQLVWQSAYNHIDIKQSK